MKTIVAIGLLLGAAIAQAQASAAEELQRRTVERRAIEAVKKALFEKAWKLPDVGEVK